MSQEKHWGKDPIIGTADTRARMEEALPTDPEAIIERNRREREKAAEFDRLLRDNELVRLQGDLIADLQTDRDRLAKRVRTLEERAVVAREESDAPPEKRERGDRRSEPYRQEQCRRRPAPQRVEVRLVEAKPFLESLSREVPAYRCVFKARVLDVVQSPPTGEHHMDWEWSFGSETHHYPYSEVKGLMVNAPSTVMVRARAGGEWVPEGRESDWSHPVAFRITPRDFSLVAHHGQVRKWRNFEPEGKEA